MEEGAKRAKTDGAAEPVDAAQLLPVPVTEPVVEAAAAAVAGDGVAIQAGDFIIMYENPDAMVPVKVTPGEWLQTRHGMFAHCDLVGHPIGQKLYSTKGGAGWMYPLRATPELLTSGGLAHRTQLVHSSDISFITFAMELRAGSIVVESGTGSGSLTNALARITGDSGKVFSFEFHAERAQQAREAFVQFGNAARITVTTRDVCAEGFLVDGALAAGGAHAVFLDLPSPWLAITHARHVLRGGGVLCCYSPCFEQVVQTCAELRRAEFLEVTTVEVRQRPWEVQAVSRSTWDFDVELERTRTGDRFKRAPGKRREAADQMRLMARPAGHAPGHTAYLTYSRKRLETPAPAAVPPPASE